MIRIGEALLVIALGAVAQAASGLPPVVAVVNGREITSRELERRVAQSRSMDPERFDGMSESAKNRAVARVLNAIILQELEYQEALRQGIEVSDGEVNRALHKARRSFPSDAAFRAFLSSGRITVGEWREEMKRALMIARLEAKISAGEPASQWASRRPVWIQSLRTKARIWTALPASPPRAMLPSVP